MYLQSRKGLSVNIDSNCRKFLGASFSILKRFGNLSESVLSEIILTKYLPILAKGMECFALLCEQKRKMCVAFNSVNKRIFRSSRFTSVRDVNVYIGSKPCDILLDERRFLLNMSCLN